ncbi:phage gene 29 protein family protein [Mycolicibacterium sp. XJ1819]
MTAPTINPNTFPYLKKFTTEEREDLFERIDQFRHAMTDMVGPSGVVMYIDAGTIANIAFHLAMAGGRIVDDEHAYIWADVQEDQDGIFEGFIDWKLKKEHEPPAPKPAEGNHEDVERKAALAREQIRKQLAPEVEQELIKQLRIEFERDTTDPDPSEE